VEVNGSTDDDVDEVVGTRRRCLGTDQYP